MGRSKIVNEQEVLRWFEEGRTYAWMQAEYLRRYDVETGISMWANFRKHRGLDRRTVRDDELIPWCVQEQHRYVWPIKMLRAEARQRAGGNLTPNDAAELRGWRRSMDGHNQVVAYDPVHGFSYVSRRPGIDLDLIRMPDRPTTRQRNTG